jgi:hypothetical protein
MGMDSVLTSPTTLRTPARDLAGRTAEDLLRAEIRAWASWKHNPRRFEVELLAAHGLAPLDEPTAADAARPAPEPEPAADPIEHGTTRGARKHRERDEDLCDRCWGAARAANRTYKAAARARKADAQ